MRVTKDLQISEIQKRLANEDITVTKSVIDAVITAYAEMIRTNLLNGFTVLTNIGTFGTYTSKPTYRKSPKDQSDINIPAQVRPRVKFNSSLVSELKELPAEEETAA